MGVLGFIAGQKAKFQGRIAMRQAGITTDEDRRNQAQKEAEKLQKLRAETLKAEGMAKLQREEMMLKERLAKAKGPSTIQKVGKGLAGVINKGRAHSKKSGGLMIGAPRSSGSKGLEMGGKKDVFGGASGLNTGGSGLQIGKPMPKKEKPKSTTIIIKQ